MEKINEDVLKQMKIIQKKISPFVEEQLAKNEITSITTLFYFAGVVKELLKEEDKDIKELILRYMLD